MKKAFFILVLAAAALAVSCNREEAFKNTEVKTIDVDQAYVTVVITESGSSVTRAVDDDAVYQNGTAEERNVARAEFYFYDHFGDYVTSATVWNDGTENTTDENIEFEGNTVIVLEDIYGKQSPMYMVTVLNPDQNFVPANRLSDFQTQYSYNNTTDGGLFRTDNSVNYFTMSTTSWGGQDINLGEDGDNYAPYFVNKITDEHFQKAPVADGDEITTPVVVYVERLAAKVEVGVNSTLAATAETMSVQEEVEENGETTTTTTTKSLYPLEVTIAGDENSDDDDDEDIGAEEIYIDLIGWKLNATSKHSYVSKNIDETTWGLTTNNLSFAWNDPDYYRSYWAMSPSYGWQNAPTSSNNLTEDEEATQWADYYLNYVSLADETTLFPLVDGTTTHNYTYCAENTNTAVADGGLIQNKNSSLITSVLIKAKLYIKDPDNDYCTPLENVVRYEGVLWTENRYIDYVLDHANVYRVDEDNSYTEEVTTTDPATGEETTTTVTHTAYVTIDHEYAEATLEEQANSIMYVKIGNETGPYYVKNSTGDDYTTIEYDELVAQIDRYNKAFQAVGYTDGLMYYTIPIKHLGSATEVTEGEGEDAVTEEIVAEGQYGVVRNHYYKVTINSLIGVGRGISNEDEIIVPNGDDEDDTIYAVGAQINILSWRLVEQGVDL